MPFLPLESQGWPQLVKVRRVASAKQINFNMRTMSHCYTRTLLPTTQRFNHKRQCRLNVFPSKIEVTPTSNSQYNYVNSRRITQHWKCGCYGTYSTFLLQGSLSFCAFRRFERLAMHDGRYQDTVLYMSSSSHWFTDINKLLKKNAV